MYNNVMNYNPIVFQMTNNNYLDRMYQFIKNWYEIDIVINTKENNFGEIYGVYISSEINSILNLLYNLSYSIVYGKKRYIYNGLEYIFGDWSLNMKLVYDEKLKILFVFKEGKQDFYYGIKHEDFHKSNPFIYKIIKQKDKIEEYKYFHLMEFVIFHICTSVSKAGLKSFITSVKSDMEDEIKCFEKIFEHKKQFSNFTIYETENIMASISDNVNIKILRINQWKKDKELMERVVNIFGWNGWSNNSFRYRL